MIEEWRPIPFLSAHFRVSNLGRVKRVASAYTTTFRGRELMRGLPERVFACRSLSSKGYPRVNLDGRVWTVHALVAAAFLPNPDGLPQVNHKNGIKTDNRATNLEWVTNQGNRDHAVATGLQPRGSRISKRLIEEDIPMIRWLLAIGATQRDVAREYGICQQTVSHIHRRSTWTHV